MAIRRKKVVKSAKAPNRAKSGSESQSTGARSAQPKPRRPKTGERQSDSPRSETGDQRNLLRASEERQAATADILKVIASSPSDLQPVFDAILDRALQLCEAAFGFLTKWDGERFEFAAERGEPTELSQHFGTGMDQPRPGDAHWRLVAGEDLIHNLDQKDEEAYRAGNPLRRAVVDLGGARSALVVALRTNGSLR